ncbi:retrotransposon hot spot (RHS) protein [Trypanosoma cruzi]|nr:retrotransposon hot spot (RHS) protein [Trypanosoma cruzi]
MATKDLFLLILRLRGALASRALEQLGLRVFMYGELVIALVEELNELRSSERNEAQDSVLKVNHQGHPTRTVGLGDWKAVSRGFRWSTGCCAYRRLKTFRWWTAFSLWTQIQ